MPEEKVWKTLADWSVFAVALVLAAVILLHAAGRCARRPAPAEAEAPDAAGSASRVADGASGTESAVSALPPIRLSRMGAGRRERLEVPAPREGGKGR